MSKSFERHKLLEAIRKNNASDKPVYIVFALVAGIMSILNIVTQRHVLLISTAVFCALSIVDFLICTFVPKWGSRIARWIFFVQIIALFSYFIVTGGTDNFSIVWLLMLPTCGLFFFGMEAGTLACGIIMAIMLAFFYIPGLKEVCTDYGDTFRLRFPIVFTLAYGVAFILEYMREALEEELEKARYQYRELYQKDELTGVKNRHGLDVLLQSLFKENQPTFVGTMILDIDFFKNVNDEYGHDCGDYVLKELAQMITEVIGSENVIRWGGEEFLMITESERTQHIVEKAEQLRTTVENHEFQYHYVTFKLTVSIGVSCGICTGVTDFYEQIKHTDQNLYVAKKNGRNNVVHN